MSLEEDKLMQQVQDELKALEPEVKVEEKQEEVTQEAPQFSQVELEQMEKGWDPNHEGPNKVSAEEFKRVGEIIDAKRAAAKKADLATREVEELTKSVKQLVEHNKLIAKAAREQALREVEQKRMEAVEAGDMAAFNLADAQRNVALAQPVQEQTQAKPVSAEILSFQERYKDVLDESNTDPTAEAMRASITSRVAFYLKTNPDVDEKVAIADIEDRLKKAFPAKFETPKPKAALVGSSTARSTGKVDSNLSSMTVEERSLLQSIQFVDKTYTAEMFAKDYLNTKK